MSTIRTQMIRLAHSRPDLRPHLLPILVEDVRLAQEREASAAIVRMLFSMCVSSSTCRKISAQALRLPDAIHQKLARFAGAAGIAALEKAGVSTEHTDFVAKVADVARELGRIPQAPMLLLADIIEGMSDDEAEAVKALV